MQTTWGKLNGSSYHLQYGVDTHASNFLLYFWRNIRFQVIGYWLTLLEKKQNKKTIKLRLNHLSILIIKFHLSSLLYLILTSKVSTRMVLVTNGRNGVGNFT